VNLCLTNASLHKVAVASQETLRVAAEKVNAGIRNVKRRRMLRVEAAAEAEAIKRGLTERYISQ